MEVADTLEVTTEPRIKVLDLNSRKLISGNFRSDFLDFRPYGASVCVAVCCSVLQCVAVYCSVCCSVLQRVAVCCSVVMCVAVCCSVLLCSV